MASPNVEQRRKEAEMRAEHAKAQEEVRAASQEEQARIAEFSGLTPGEKSDMTRRREQQLRAENAEAQRKALRNAPENKAMTPEEDKGLDDVMFASPQAKDAAAEAGLTADNFKRRRKSSDGGFTKADVERIAASVGTDEE